MPFIRKADLQELVKAGNLASNICYNLAQRHEMLPRESENMRETYDRWDKSKAALPKGLFKRRGKK